LGWLKKNAAQIVVQHFRKMLGFVWSVEPHVITDKRGGRIDGKLFFLWK